MISFVIRNPHISFGQALRGYLRFYERLRPYRDRFVVGGFDEVTNDFGAIVRRVNERFGTGFALFEHTQENVQRCFRAIDSDYRGRLAAGEPLERQVARPSEWRDRKKEEMRSSYRSGHARLRARAERIFRTLADAPGE